MEGFNKIYLQQRNPSRRQFLTTIFVFASKVIGIMSPLYLKDKIDHILYLIQNAHFIISIVQTRYAQL